MPWSYLDMLSKDIVNSPVATTITKDEARVSNFDPGASIGDETSTKLQLHDHASNIRPTHCWKEAINKKPATQSSDA